MIRVRKRGTKDQDKVAAKAANNYSSYKASSSSTFIPAVTKPD